MPIEHDPSEPDDDPPPESEKPRFLLSDGCKDLMDVLRQRAEREISVRLSSSENPAPVFSDVNTLPDAITILDLAAVLHIKPFHIVSILMELNVFASLYGSIDFSVARLVCLRCGVLAQKTA